MKVHFASLLLILLAAAPLARGGRLKVSSVLSKDQEETNPGIAGSGSDLVPHDRGIGSAGHPMDPGILGSDFVLQDLLQGSVGHPVDEENVGSSTVPRDGTKGSLERQSKKSKRRFLSLKKAPKFSKKDAKAAKKAKAGKNDSSQNVMEECVENKGLVVGKRLYIPGCSNFIDEVSIECNDEGVCTYFQEAIKLYDCGEEAVDPDRCQLIGQFFFDSSKPVSAASSNPTCTQEISVSLTSHGACSFKDEGVDYGAPNALKAYIEPSGQMAIFFSADNGKSFFSDARVAELDDGSRRHLNTCNACSNIALTTCSAESDFCPAIGIKDLFKGFKTSGVGKGPSTLFVFDIPELRYNKFEKQRDNFEFITNSDSAKKSIGISAELSISYGPFSGELSGKYLSDSSSSSDYFRYTITLVRQWGSITANTDSELKYKDRFTDYDQVQLFDEVGGRYISEIVLGTKMTFKFKKQSSASNNKQEIAGALKGAVKKVGVGVELNGKINVKDGETKNTENLNLELKAEGVIVDVENGDSPIGPNADWFGYIGGIVNKFKEETAKKFKEMDEFVKDNKVPNTNANFSTPLSPVAFFAARIEKPLKEWEPDVGPSISAKLKDAGTLLGDVQYFIGRLEVQKNKFDDLEDQDVLFSLKYQEKWLPAYKKLLDSLKLKRDAIFNFAAASNRQLIEGAVQLPPPLDADVENDVNALLGYRVLKDVEIKGQKIPGLVWKGFVLDGTPFWKGEMLCTNLAYQDTGRFEDLEAIIEPTQCKPAASNWVQIQDNANVKYDNTIVKTVYSKSFLEADTTADKAVDSDKYANSLKNTSFLSTAGRKQWWYIDIRSKKIINNPYDPSTKMWSMSNEPFSIRKIEIYRDNPQLRRKSMHFKVSVVLWSNPPQGSPDKYGALKPACDNIAGPDGGFDGITGETLLCSHNNGFQNYKPGGTGNGVVVWNETWTDRGENKVPSITKHEVPEGTRGQYVVVEMLDSQNLYISDIKIYSDEPYFDPPHVPPIAPEPECREHSDCPNFEECRGNECRPMPGEISAHGCQEELKYKDHQTECSHDPHCPDGFTKLREVDCNFLGWTWWVCRSETYLKPPCTRPLKGTCGGGDRGNGCCADANLGCSMAGWCGHTEEDKSAINPSYKQCLDMGARA